MFNSQKVFQSVNEMLRYALFIQICVLIGSANAFAAPDGTDVLEFGQKKRVSNFESELYAQDESTGSEVSTETDVQQGGEESVQPEVSPDQEALQTASVNTTAPGNVSLDFKDADILNVLRVLSLKSGTNIVAGPEVQGTVTIRLQDVHWEKAMDVVLRTYGYVYEREGNIIRVTTKDNLATEELVTETFVLNYTTAAEVEEAIKDVLSERGRVKSVPRANTILVTDVPTNIYKVSQVIQALDQATQQVYIDAKVVRTQLDINEDIGIKWNLAASSANPTVRGGARPTTFPFTAPGHNAAINPLSYGRYFYPGTSADPSNDPSSAPSGTPDLSSAEPTAFTYGTLDFSQYTSALNFLRQKTNTKIVSNPRIVVLNNQTAKVQVGSQIPIPNFERNETTGSFVISGFTYRDIGVVLNVTPHINASREILINLKPEVSSQGADVSFGSGVFTAPSFNTTVAETQLLIRDGETIAIGGLARDSANILSSQVPGISKVPLIGRLFRNSVRSSSGDANQKVETLFFITITIIDTKGQPTVVQQLVPSTTVVADAAQSSAGAATAAMQTNPSL